MQPNLLFCILERRAADASSGEQNHLPDNLITMNLSAMDLNGTDLINTSDSQCVHYLTNRTEDQFLEVHIPTVMAISRILPPIWWFIGIIGNIMALIVWLQPKMRHSSGYYLAALAITDLCFLPLSIVFIVHYVHGKQLLDEPILCQWFVITYLTFQYMSPVLVLAFTVERYLSVCHPFRMVNFNQSNSKVTIVVIFSLALFCVALNGIQGLFWAAKHDGMDEHTCNIQAQHTKAWNYMTWTTEMLIFVAVPVTILILNVLVIWEVRSISKLERRNMRTNSIDRRSTTLMLLGVSFYQIFTVLPVTVTIALFNQFPSGDACLTDRQMDSDPTWISHFKYTAVKNIIHNIGMSHYAANFFIYMMTGKLFRKQLYELFAVFCCKEKLLYLSTKTGMYTRTTRMSLTSHRGSIAAKGRPPNAKLSDPCNNDTELGNKNSLYSATDFETHHEMSTVNGGHGLRPSSVGTRLLPCVEESDVSDHETEQHTDKPLKDTRT